MKKIMAFAAAALALAACSEKEVLVERPVEEKISVTATSYTFSSEGGTVPVIVTSTEDWTLESPANSLFTPSVKSGKDGDVVTFTAAANTTGEVQTAEFVFKTTNKQAKFTATSLAEKGGELALVTSSELDLLYTVKSLDVDLTSTLNYRDIKYEISESAKDWISFRVAVNEGDGKARLNFVLTQNDGKENREGTITFSGDNVPSVSLKVVQRAQPVITPEKSTFVLPLEGGSVAFAVESNIEYAVAVTYEEGVAEWLTYDGKKDGKESFSAPAADAKRYATVTLTEKNPIEGVDPLVVKVNIRQTPPALITTAANMTGARAHIITWNAATKTALTNASAFTAEALVRADDFKRSGSLSTIMGIEGSYLIRIGDAAIPSNQLQIASSSNVTGSAARLDVGKWYHIAVVFQSGTVTAYVNGARAFSGSAGKSTVTWGVDHGTESGSWGNITRRFWVGYAYDGARDFKGLMSELRIWNKALTPDEINAPDHFYSVDPKSEGLLCYWKMDEGSGSIFKDSTGNGNDLQGEINVRDQNNSWVGDEGANYAEVSLPE